MNYQNDAALAAASDTPWPNLGPARSYNALQRQQAAFESGRRRVSAQNWPLVIPALAPAAVVAGLEAGGAAAGRLIAPTITRAPLKFFEDEISTAPNVLKQIGRPLADARTDGAIRSAARQKFARAYGIEAREMGEAQVHHNLPLEYREQFPDMDMNDLSNLSGLPKPPHQAGSAIWTAFRQSLNGRTPTQAEIYAVRSRVNKITDPHLLTRSRSWNRVKNNDPPN